MSEQNSLPTQIQALPDGGAELHLVVRMRWEDIATLGREAGRLAVRLQRPVSLDEAAGHKLSGRSAATAHDLAEQAPRALPVAPPPAETAAPHPNGTATAAANTAVTVNVTAVAGVRRIIGAVIASGSVAAGVFTLTIQDGATTVFVADLNLAAGVPWSLPAPVECTAGNAVTVTLSAGGSTVVGKLNVGYYDLVPGVPNVR